MHTTNSRLHDLNGFTASLLYACMTSKMLSMNSLDFSRLLAKPGPESRYKSCAGWSQHLELSTAGWSQPSRICELRMAYNGPIWSNVLNTPTAAGSSCTHTTDDTEVQRADLDPVLDGEQ